MFEPTLLPPNASELERTLESTLQRATALNVEINKLWSADHCPTEFLPWLAWALSVEEWDSEWDESIKRAAIESSITIHRQKGTKAAIERALLVMGIAADITEGFEVGGPPHTFSIDLWLLDQPNFQLNDGWYRRLFRAIDQVKPVRSHYTLKIGIGWRSHLYQGSVLRPSLTESRTVALGLRLASDTARVGLWLGVQVTLEQPVLMELQ